ncbi:MAG TPA: hypothetical protein VJS69_09890 [Candidatus Krumholzibacteria bacterium]|nr:hypothetical protein [Candidatus Krumholzibacteria bacterium]
MNTNKLLALLAVCVVPVLLAGCLDDKVLDLVATGETYVDFPQNETSSSWTKPAVIDVGREIRDILNNNGYDESDIKSAHVTSVHYGVSSFDQAHDWTITGAITVAYNGNTQTIMNYASQSVQAALGKKIPATLQAPGVDLINQALQDFIDGGNPVLTFTINNGSTTPVPSGGDPMIFDWRAWLAIQIILKQEVKIPDPF